MSGENLKSQGNPYFSEKVRHYVGGEDDFRSHRYQESRGIGPQARGLSLGLARGTEEARLGNVSHRSPSESKSWRDHSVATVSVKVLERTRGSTPASPKLAGQWGRRACVVSSSVAQKVRPLDSTFETSSSLSPRPRFGSCLHTIPRLIGESVRESVSVYVSVDRTCLAYQG